MKQITKLIGTDTRYGEIAFEITYNAKAARKWWLVRVRGGGAMEGCRTLGEARRYGERLVPGVRWTKLAAPAAVDL